MHALKKPFIYIILLVVIALVLVLFLGKQKEEVTLLYATGNQNFDTSAYDGFKQSLLANLKVEQRPLEGLTLRQLQAYDAIYLDPGLHKSNALKGSPLVSYVEKGGQLFLENLFADEFPLDLIGAKELVNLPTESLKDPKFQYPQVAVNLQAFQEVIQRFTESFAKYDASNEMPQFHWGTGIIPSTAESIANKDGVSIYSYNRYGTGTVLLASEFLPNRYFLTGTDMASGMSSDQGFKDFQTSKNSKIQHVEGTSYFDRNKLPIEPYFHFGFHAANSLLRDEYVSFVSKEKWGYSVKKVLGPYGRPAMAFQNHYEEMDAIKEGKGEHYADLLKDYNMVPSFSLVRTTYPWGEWWESLVVHLNEGDSGKPKFYGELPASYYSSGTHLMNAKGPIRLLQYPKPTQLAEPIEEAYRAAPAFVAVTAGGPKDMVTGSADGKVWLHRNLGQQAGTYDPRNLPRGIKAPDAFAAPELLFTAAGGFATIAAADLNGDGRDDLLLGGAAGAVQAALRQPDGKYAAPQPLAGVKVPDYSAPSAADWNRDGTLDLAVGDGTGRVHLFQGVPGQPMKFAPASVLFDIGAKYAAPSAYDWNNDGKLDLVIGNQEGDLLVYVQESNGWNAQGPITGTTMNQMGNNALVGGHNSVPVWYDLNHDGKDDLIVGQTEFSRPVEVADPKFEYRAELNNFIKYAKDNKLPIYPHVYVHGFESPEQEKEELARHKASFDALGLPWTMTGTNQHTWRINNPDRTQTLLNERSFGIWFNFAFRPSYVPTDPSLGSDYVWTKPFLLTGPNVKEPILLHSPSLGLVHEGDFATKELYDSLAALDMPIDYFEHIENKDDPFLLKMTEYFNDLRNTHDYNFMTEDQMAQSFLTALTGQVEISRSYVTLLRDTIKNLISPKGPRLSLTLDVDKESIPSLAGDYANTMGVVVEKGQKYYDSSIATDADHYDQRGNNLYIGLARKAELFIHAPLQNLHVTRANVPYELTKGKDSWTITTKGESMQQIKLYSPKPLEIKGDDLKIEQDEKNHTYTITHFGENVTITLSTPTD